LSASRRRSPPASVIRARSRHTATSSTANLLPAFGRRVAALTVDDVADLLHQLRRKGCSAKTAAGALATLQSVMRFARRRSWIVAAPVERLEHDERPRPQRRRQRVLGRAEIERLLAACSPRDRLMVATVLYTGLRISEMLGLVWDDVDLSAGALHVRAQLSRAHRSDPARRVAPKNSASVRIEQMCIGAPVRPPAPLAAPWS
jgi:integrase